MGYRWFPWLMLALATVGGATMLAEATWPVGMSTRWWAIGFFLLGWNLFWTVKGFQALP